LFSPAHIESILLISTSYCTITSTLIGIFGCWIWVKQPALPGIKIKIFTAAIYFSALLFKESIIVLPGLLILLDYGMHRIPDDGNIRKVLKYLVGYWPFIVSIAFYSLIYIFLGLYSDSIGYASYSGHSATELLNVWNNYSRAMFMPFSTFIEWRTGTLGFIWLFLLIFFIHVNKKSLWAFLWIFLSFLTMFSRFHYRFTYLPMIGFVIAFAIIANGFNGWIRDHVRKKVLAVFLNSSIIAVVLLFIVLSYRSIQRELQSWEVASKLTYEIPRKANELVANPPENAEMIFIGVPESYGNAHVYGWGLVDETRFVYNMPALNVKQVVDANHGHWRIKLQDIYGRSENPRYLFYFNPVSLEIDRVDVSLPGTDYILK
jgi:hypothetical protein